MIAPIPDSPVRHRQMLVVDDEEPVRHVLRRYLARRGWTVIEASSAESAMTMLADVGTFIDAVIVDLRLPGVSGAALCRRIPAMRPDLLGRVLVSSGDASAAVAELARDAVRCPVLAKPFELGELDDALAGLAGAV